MEDSLKNIEEFLSTTKYNDKFRNGLEDQKTVAAVKGIAAVIPSLRCKRTCDNVVASLNIVSIIASAAIPGFGPLAGGIISVCSVFSGTIWKDNEDTDSTIIKGIEANELKTKVRGCGKTEFVLDLLEGEYSGVFKYIVILCPTIQWNKAYKNREWIGDVRKPKTKNLIIVNPIVEVREANGSLYEEEKLQELLRMFFKKYAGHPTLYIIDDCSATKELTKKKDMLSELAFSGRHAEQSVWVISQRYNSVLKDLREQTKWLCMFYTKDRDSFDNCLRENDVIPTLEERQRIKEELKKKKHRKLILKTDQPTDYWLID
ncbi:unnamed protein product [Mytilus coruscus]|uniref:Uncharacterized protein n=1 Tax=Mytilus coruscus TaxID=42192 RepID=A0A6J8BRS9_MYTCO|nr:unnamed protein product [Mytilus coruscus]